MMTKQKFSNKSASETYQHLLAQLSATRAGQKKISDFNTVDEWLAYGRETAEKKASILAEMAKLAALFT